jgi:hypothetical protein
VAGFGLKDAANITKDFFVFLPSFDSNNNDDYDGVATNSCERFFFESMYVRLGLLRMLLEWSASWLKEDLTPGPNPASLDSSVSPRAVGLRVPRRGGSDPD